MHANIGAPLGEKCQAGAPRPSWVQKSCVKRERGWFRCVKIMNEIESVASASAASNARKLYPGENDDGEDTVVAMR